MQDAARVSGDERIGDPRDPFQADRELGRARLAQHVVERAALDELHHEDVAAALVVLDDVEQRDDVRVADRGGGARFAQHAHAVFGVAREIGHEHLDRDVAIEPLVARAPHLAHRAFAELRDEPIRSDQIAGLGHGRIVPRYGVTTEIDGDEVTPGTATFARM